MAAACSRLHSKSKGFKIHNSAEDKFTLAPREPNIDIMRTLCIRWSWNECSYRQLPDRHLYPRVLLCTFVVSASSNSNHRYFYFFVSTIQGIVVQLRIICKNLNRLIRMESIPLSTETNWVAYLHNILGTTHVYQVIMPFENLWLKQCHCRDGEECGELCKGSSMQVYAGAFKRISWTTYVILAALVDIEIILSK